MSHLKKRISKLDRKTNEYIRGKMDAQDMILDEITRKNDQVLTFIKYLVVTEGSYRKNPPL